MTKLTIEIDYEDQPSTSDMYKLIDAVRAASQSTKGHVVLAEFETDAATGILLEAAV